MSLHPFEDSQPVGPAHEAPLKRSETGASNEEEQNYCRICRGEGTAAQPLYYPCKCSGSIKFVHQECLMEWLSHSQKKYCELCKTSFRFTKLYDRSMPARLPAPLFVRQLARHAVREFARWTRYLLVGIIWTCCLPWCIRQVWRGFLWLADGSAPVAYDTQLMAEAMSNTTAATSIPQAQQPLFGNITIPDYLERITLILPPMLISLGDIARLILGQGLIGRIIGFILSIFIPRLVYTDGVAGISEPGSGMNETVGRSPSLLSDVDFISAWSSSRFVNNATVDVIEGQLICVLLVTAFILVFLIREWVINQQPILNMPDPDAADNPPQEHQAENERPRLGVIRPRNRHQDGDANADAEVGGGGANPVARPIAVPRRRRALTDDNILNGTGDEIERPALPVRSQSLLTNSEDALESDGEEAVGESSAVAVDHESWPTRRHSTSTHNTEEGSTFNPFDAQAANVGGVLDLDRFPIDAGFDFSFGGVQTLDEQQNERDEGTGEPLARRVSFAQVPAIIEGAAAQPAQLDAHEISTDSDGPVIPTPDSSNDIEFPLPAAELLDPDFQQALFNNAPLAEPEERPAPNDQDHGQEQPDDLSLLRRISRWLWHIDIEIDAQVAARTRDSAHEETQDEVRIVEDVNAEAPFVPVHNREAPQIPPLPPVNEAPPPAEAREPNMVLGVDLNDAADDAEDLDGVLELLGMEGPIFGMIQNVLFSLLLITITLLMSFWFPYMWGKIALLFLSQPTLMLIRAPLFVLSRSADIVVDIIFFVAGLAGFLFNQPMKIVKAATSFVSPSLGNIVDTTAIEGFALDLSQKSGTRLERTLTAAVLGLKPDVPNFSMQSHHALISLKTCLREAFQGAAFAAIQVHRAFTSDRPSSRVILSFIGRTLRSVPDALRKLPKITHVASDWLGLLFTDLSTEPTILGEKFDPSLAEWNNDDRILVIILGYALFAVAGIVFLEIAHLVLGLKDGEKVEGYFADSLRQAGGVMKVIVIIGIEMLVFPLYCGLLLDLALLPLFANATLASRITFMMRTPLTGIFIHWFIGTCYMFHFALFVSICRKIMRKGVLYFIRDPDDPTFHPVRDVLERPVPAQLGKILFSALVYGGLVTVCLGSVVWSLDWVGGVLPIRWSTPEPRLAFPIDIVFYNFLLPFILRKAEPSKKISAMYKWWFRGCAKALRLTHFLFGEERKEEQYTHPRGFPWVFLFPHTIDEPTHDGSYVRAPASDSVRIAKGRDVFLEVTEENERLDGRPDSDFGMHGKKDPQFTKIYLPPNFRSRISTFIVLLWLFAASTGVAFTVGPLVVGRTLTQLLSQSTHPPNDLYAFTVGVHIFAAVGYAVAYAGPARAYLREKVRSSGTQILASILHVLGLAYLAVFITIVLPFVMALITELYIHMPVFDMLEFVTQEKAKEASTSSSGSTSTSASHAKVLPGATIYILQSWTIGLLYLRIMLRVLTHAIEPRSRIGRAMRAITRNGVLHADIPLASRAFVLPITTICLIALVVPVAWMKCIITLFRVDDLETQMRMYRFAYPLFLYISVNYASFLFVRKKLRKWRVKIRDEVYLIGERLHNFQEVKPKVGKASAESAKGKEKAL